jgi:hypothetical protein
MEIQAALDSYTRATTALADLEKANESIFNTRKQLALRVLDADGELRDAVAIAGHGISNRNFEVKYTPNTMTFADIDVIDSLIKEGKISPDLRDKIVKTVDRPPRINIVQVKEDAE